VNTWPAVRLGDVLRQRKQFIAIDDLTNYRRPRVRLHAQGIVLRDEVSGALIKTKAQQVCRVGELLVAEIDAKVGGFGVVPEGLSGAIVSSHYFLFEIDESRLSRKFLDYFIRTPAFRDQVEAQGTTNYAAIRPADVLTYEISLPPLAEQQRLVARIDSLSAEVRCAIGVASSSDFEVAAMDKALLHALLPRSTETRPLGSLLAPERKLSYGVLVPGAHDDEGVALVRVQDLALRPNGAPPARRVSAQIDRQYSRTRLRGDEVLIGVVGSIGKVGIAPATWAGANIARAVCRIAPSAEIDRAYLAAVLSAAATQQYFQEATRTLAQPTLNVAQLARTPFQCPHSPSNIASSLNLVRSRQTSKH
jgi:type I restriction enzyme, S subunit